MSPFIFILGFSITVKAFAPKLITRGIKVIEISCAPGEQEQNNFDIT